MYLRSLFVATFVIVAVFAADQPDPSRFVPFLKNNLTPDLLPLSFSPPVGYFGNLTAAQRPNDFKAPANVPECGKDVSAANLNAYSFQTEILLTTSGLNLYDGAIWSMALATGADSLPQVKDYQSTVLIGAKTAGLDPIKAGTPCVDFTFNGACKDSCGFCYGSNGDNGTLPSQNNAFFFRLIGDTWDFGVNEKDARCPDVVVDNKPVTFKWNDWRPTTGANAWASLIGPLQVAYYRNGNDATKISDNSDELILATDIIPALEHLVVPVPSASGVRYAPYNSYSTFNGDIGSTAWTDDNAAVLLGLKYLQTIIQAKGSSSKFYSLLPRIATLISKVQTFLLSSYDPSQSLFRQGGIFTIANSSWTWDTTYPFSVSSQTWVIAALGPALIDSTFGSNTAYKVWNSTKVLGGYKYVPGTGRITGLGFSANSVANIFSGDLSLNAIATLRILLDFYKSSLTQISIGQDITDIRAGVESELTHTYTLPKGVSSTTIYYSNVRTLVPFGYYANPIPSLGATSWAYLIDKNYNPFVLGGGAQGKASAGVISSSMPLVNIVVVTVALALFL